MLHLVYMSV